MSETDASAAAPNAPVGVTQNLFTDKPVRFGPGFLREHAGRIMTDPRVALVELVSNSYDAGATEVLISWPAVGGELRIADNGHGMTSDQFDERWRTLGYKRTLKQSAHVEFPPAVSARPRHALGQHGKGRHGAFCFADRYLVETWRESLLTVATVTLVAGDEEPYHCDVVTGEGRVGHGTVLRVPNAATQLQESDVRETLGSTFLIDPDFRVYVNDDLLELEDLESLSTTTIDVPGYDPVTIHQVFPQRRNRTTHLKGITYWVHGKRVGMPSWKGLDDEGSLLDGRKSEAKSYAFIVIADQLHDQLKPEWTGFYATAKTQAVTDAVREHVRATIRGLLHDARRERKKHAIAENKWIVKDLPVESQNAVGEFIDRVLESCPSISEGDIVKTTEILAKLENARSGYDLLNQLNQCSPDDLDRWNEIMKQWTARGAEIVLTELQRRLALIEDLQRLVHSHTTDELHELQPLFEKGLWMFGPEYDRVDFRSNRGMAEVIRGFLKADVDHPLSRRRPDFVATADASIGAYASDSYDEAGDVIGVDKALIVELKRGGFELKQSEVDQARNYALEIRRVGAVQKHSTIICYVLGATLDEGLDETTVGSPPYIRVLPVTYDTILRRAHARTFHLEEKLRKATATLKRDAEVLEVLESDQDDLFEHTAG
jgi:hypothetical protein